MRGVNAESARRDNLSTVLTQVHRAGSVARAQLTRTTGLNRSTIGALVSELVDRGLVVESDPEPTKSVGRPSLVVRPNPDVVAFAVNPEIDAITVGMVGMHGRVITRRRLDLDRAISADHAAQLTATLINEIREGEPVAYRSVGIGVAVPGLVRSKVGVVRLAPHLGWENAPLATMVAARTHQPALVGNDATLGAIAERTFGVAQGVDNLVYLNGGASGIGGGVIVAGQPLVGIDGYAGEFGHNQLSLRSTDGVHHSEFEGHVSRSRLLAALGWTSATPEELDDAIRLAVPAPLVAELRRQQAVLSLGIAQAVNIFNPEMIVLGGFLSSILAYDRVKLISLVSDLSLTALFERVVVTGAQLGSDLLLIGAAELAFARLLDNPGSPDYF